MMAFLRFLLMGALLASGGTAAARDNLLKVRFATDWKAQAEQGGFYQAKALGLYEQAGLDVEIRGGGPGINIPQLLGAGAIEFGMGSNSFIPLNIVKAGVPAKAVMAASHPLHPFVNPYLSRRSSILMYSCRTITSFSSPSSGISSTLVSGANVILLFSSIPPRPGTGSQGTPATPSISSLFHLVFA